MQIMVVFGRTPHKEWDNKYPNNMQNDPVIQAWQRYELQHNDITIIGATCPSALPTNQIDAVIEYEAPRRIHNAGIDKLKCLKILHCQDTVFYPEWHNFLAPKFDMIICAQRNAERVINHPNKVFIPSGFDPKMKDLGVKKEYDIGLISGKRDFDYRKSYFQKLPSNVSWNIWTGIKQNEMVNILNLCRMGLNVSSSGTEDMLAYRICETLSCGLLLITDRLKNNVLDEFYTENVHYLGYNKGDYEEFINRVLWVKENPQEAEIIRKNGQERVQEFTWDKHVERIVSVIRTKIG